MIRHIFNSIFPLPVDLDFLENLALNDFLISQQLRRIPLPRDYRNACLNFFFPQYFDISRQFSKTCSFLTILLLAKLAYHYSKRSFLILHQNCINSFNWEY